MFLVAESRDCLERTWLCLLSFSLSLSFVHAQTQKRARAAALSLFSAFALSPPSLGGPSRFVSVSPALVCPCEIQCQWRN